MAVAQKSQRQSCEVEIFQQLEIGVLLAVGLPRIQQFVPMLAFQKADDAVRRLLLIRRISESLKRRFILEERPVRLHLLALNGDALTPQKRPAQQTQHGNNNVILQLRFIAALRDAGAQLFQPGQDGISVRNFLSKAWQLMLEKVALIEVVFKNGYFHAKDTQNTDKS